jgi:hypothetical protein
MLVVEPNRVNVGSRVVVVACALSIALAASVARAQDNVPLRLRYDAPSECPGADAFFAQVVARTALARPAAANAPATELRVTIRSVPGGHAGTLELRTREAETATREVSAAQCSQVVTALALITALAIDPNASTAPIPEPARAAPRPGPEPTQARPAPPLPPIRERFRFEIGAGLGLLANFGSDPTWLVRPFVELARERKAPLGYSLRLSAARAHASVVAGEGGVDLTLWAGRAEACPLHVPLGARVRLAPCVALELGQLQARGSGVSPKRQIDRPWLAAGALTRFELELLDALVLEVAGEILAPVVRDRFFVNTDATVYRTRAISLGATLGLAFRFP